MFYIETIEWQHQNVFRNNFKSFSLWLSVYMATVLLQDNSYLFRQNMKL